MNKPVSRRLQFIAIFALAGMAVVLWMAWDRFGNAAADISQTAAEPAGKKAKGGKRRGVPVIVARVQEARNDETVAAVGTARAKRSVMIHAKTDGVITAFNPKAGDRIAKGDLIFEIDRTKAELAVQIARKKLEEASRLFDRSEQLRRRRVNSGARVEDARTSLERAALELRQAEELLSDLRIRAPFNGTVGIAKVEVGDRVTTTTPIISLDAREELLVEFEVAEKFAARISTGGPITAMTPSHEGKRFSGRIQHIDSRVDPTSRTVMVRAVIPNENDKLRPGMSFAVELALPGTTHAAVPELSLQWRKGESYVWIVKERKVRKVLVHTVKRLNSIILVAGKLAPGDLVVVEGVQRLRPGRKVFYKKPRSPADDDSEKRSANTIDSGKG